MSPEAVKGLARWRPSRVVYVSCDPPTLARDAAALISSGYTLVAIDAYDMFPNTPHVETIAVFDAASSAQLAPIALARCQFGGTCGLREPSQEIKERIPH